MARLTAEQMAEIRKRYDDDRAGACTPYDIPEYDDVAALLSHVEALEGEHCPHCECRHEMDQAEIAAREAQITALREALARLTGEAERWIHNGLPIAEDNEAVVAARLALTAKE